MTTVPVKIPPLHGDEKGRYRIKITGNSGSGKSTLAVALAKLLRVPYISLDALYWQPGWVETPVLEFRAKILRALNEDPRGWIVDGDYSTSVGRVVEEHATDIIWLDPPLVLYFPRLVWRTALRLLRLQLGMP